MVQGRKLLCVLRDLGVRKGGRPNFLRGIQFFSHEARGDHGGMKQGERKFSVSSVISV